MIHRPSPWFLPRRWPLPRLWQCLVVLVMAVAAAATATGRPAYAQPASPSDSETPASPQQRDAQQHFKRGVALYKKDDFNTALAEFEAAYRSYPRPGVFLNIGLVHRRLHHYPEAIAALERYLAEDKDVPKQDVDEATRLIAEMRALVGELRLTIVPQGAAVVIDDRSVGKAPLAPVPLTAGDHVIELSAPDHHPLRHEVTMVSGKPLELELTLKAIPKTGQARIVSSPSFGNIFIDGRLAGSGAVEIELPAGGHTLVITAPGHQSSQQELLIAAGQNRVVKMELDRVVKKTPVHKRWWLWTAVGVAIAGGTAAAVAVPLGSRLELPTAGSLNPGSGSLNQ